VLGALILQLAVFAFGVRLPWGISTTEAHIASYLLLIAFAARNQRVPGFALAGIGLGCNAAAIFLNGGRMPVSVQAWAESTGVSIGAHAGRVYNNVAAMNSSSHLRFLGDVFAIPLWGAQNRSASPGALQGQACALTLDRSYPLHEIT
jgi:hypothetical protein